MSTLIDRFKRLWGPPSNGAHIQSLAERNAMEAYPTGRHESVQQKKACFNKRSGFALCDTQRLSTMHDAWTWLDQHGQHVNGCNGHPCVCGLTHVKKALAEPLYEHR